MRFVFLLVSLLISTNAMAQLKPVYKRDASTNRQIKPMKPRAANFYDPATIAKQVDSLLNKLVEKYAAMPNTTATWTAIKAEATDILLQYFQSGQLVGSKPGEAFFVKMDATTMTINDLQNHTMILVAGIATYAPAEFVQIKVEQKNSSNSY